VYVCIVFILIVERVLIFCQWKKMLNIIQRFVELQGWKFGRLDGNTNVAARQRLVDTFNADESYFGMLCTTRTGGVGLNLTGADRVILYDRKFFLSYFQKKNSAASSRIFYPLLLFEQRIGTLRLTHRPENVRGVSVKKEK
jgi:hypothetical protein